MVLVRAPACSVAVAFEPFVPDASAATLPRPELSGIDHIVATNGRYSIGRSYATWRAASAGLFSGVSAPADDRAAPMSRPRNRGRTLVVTSAASAETVH